MSLRIALGLTAMMAAGMSIPTGAAAGSETVEQGFYRAFNQTPAAGKAHKRRASKRPEPVVTPPAEVRHESSTELRNGAFPFDPMSARQ
jgi:hypothetical protein